MFPLDVPERSVDRSKRATHRAAAEVGVAIQVLPEILDRPGVARQAYGRPEDQHRRLDLAAVVHDNALNARIPCWRGVARRLPPSLAQILQVIFPMIDRTCPRPVELDEGLDLRSQSRVEQS